MLTTAFDAVNKQAAHGNRKPLNNQFVCQQNGLELKLAGNQIAPPLLYSGLVRLASWVLRFQQMYKIPGISFSCLDETRDRR